MPRALACPNPFKGTLSAAQAAAALCAGLADAGWQAEALPLADGGPGTLEALRAARGGRLRRLRVPGPLGRPVQAAWLDLGPREAVLESAQACGLGLSRARRPLQAGSEGLGWLLREALARGKRRIWIGLGGTASSDGGTGLARALGWRFLDARGRGLEPGGGPLLGLARVVSPARPPLPAGAELRALCDVDAPLFGPRGAAAVFSPQKGATPAQARQLDAGLRRLAATVSPGLARVPGAGAAGGLGFGLMAFAGARLVPGAASLLRLAGLGPRLRRADWLVTGEGRLDAQSLGGKLPAVAAAMAREAGKPCLAVCGELALGPRALRLAGFTQALAAPGKGRRGAAAALRRAARDWALSP